MIELIDIPSPRAVGAKISGKIEKSDLDQIIAAIEKKLQKVDKLGIYVELESFGGISFDALAEDVKFGLANLNRFDKKAVVSGESGSKRPPNLWTRFSQESKSDTSLPSKRRRPRSGWQIRTTSTVKRKHPSPVGKTARQCPSQP